MKKGMKNGLQEKTDELFGRIVSILEQARGNVVRAVNTNMVLAYYTVYADRIPEICQIESGVLMRMPCVEDRRPVFKGACG